MIQTLVSWAIFQKSCIITSLLQSTQRSRSALIFIHRSTEPMPPSRKGPVHSFRALTSQRRDWDMSPMLSSTAKKEAKSTRVWCSQRDKHEMKHSVYWGTCATWPNNTRFKMISTRSWNVATHHNIPSHGSKASRNWGFQRKATLWCNRTRTRWLELPTRQPWSPNPLTEEHHHSKGNQLQSTRVQRGRRALRYIERCNSITTTSHKRDTYLLPN